VRATRGRAGSFLIEATAALLVVAVGLGSAVVAMSMHARNVRELFEESVATQIASGELEALEARGFDAAVEGTTALSPPAEALGQLADGRCLLEVTRDRDDASLLRARAFVRWRCGRLTREVVVDTEFRRR
jgi:hypothetical protein